MVQAPTHPRTTTTAPTAKTVRGEAQDVLLDAPRDRDGIFTLRFVPKGPSSLDDLGNLIVSLYASRISIRDNWHHIAPPTPATSVTTL